MPAGDNRTVYGKSDAANPFGKGVNKMLSVMRGVPAQDVRCMELRAKGYTYAVIAQTLEIGAETARMAVERQLTRLAVELRHHAANTRELEDIRIDDMLVRNAEMVEQIFADENMDIEKRVLLMVKLHDSNIRVMERRAKMFGLDAPVKQEIQTANVTMSHAEMMKALDEKKYESNDHEVIDVTPRDSDDDQR